MKRAIDLSLKHTYLAHDVQKVEGTPYRSYLEIDEVSCYIHLATTLRCSFFHPSFISCSPLLPSTPPQVRRDQQERLENK
jgi:hypothetical protein